MINTNLLFGGAAIAGIAAVWGQIKSTAAQCARFIIRKEVVATDLYFAVDEFMKNHCWRLPTERFWYVFRICGRNSSRPRSCVIMSAAPVQHFIGFRPFFGFYTVKWSSSGVNLSYVGRNPMPSVLETYKTLVDAHENQNHAWNQVWRDYRFGNGFRVWPDADVIRQGQALDQTSGLSGSGSTSSAPAKSESQNSGGSLADIEGMDCRRGDYRGGVLSVGAVKLDMRIHEPEPERAQHADLLMAGYAYSSKAQKVLKDVRFWAQNRQWYTERDIPWRRGVLLHGERGTGKTSLVLALARRFDVPLVTLDLRGVTSSFLNRVNMRLMNYGQPVFLLIEDIDRAFKGEKCLWTPSETQPELGFDTLINFLGGVGSPDKVYTFVTANRLEDVSLVLRRPGRLDWETEIDGLNLEEAMPLLQMTLSDWPEAIDEVSQTLFKDASHSVPGAFVADECKQVARKYMEARFQQL